MINKIRAQELHHRKLIIRLGAGIVTVFIAFVYFYSVFTNRILVNENTTALKQPSPARELINSLIYVGKEATTAVKSGIETNKKTTSETPESTDEPETFAPTNEYLGDQPDNNL